MEILLLNSPLVLSLSVYYFFIELLAMIPLLVSEFVAGSYTGYRTRNHL